MKDLKLVIGVDLDSTLIKTNAASVAATALGHPHKDADVTMWNHLNFPDDLRKRIMEYFVNPIFMCDQAEPIAGAQETIKRWAEAGHTIVLITARDESIRERTLEMVNRLFPEIKDINFVGMDKSKKDVMIAKKINFWVDDAETGIIDSMSLGISTIMVSNKFTKYNWPLKTHQGLSDIVKAISDIKKF